jgi:hypothetical protein
MLAHVGFKEFVVSTSFGLQQHHDDHGRPALCFRHFLFGFFIRDIQALIWF